MTTARPIALVTGATRGIGREIALDLARTHRVIVGGRSRESVDALVADLGDAAPFVADLADADATALAVDALRGGAAAEGLDVLVHAAGLGGAIAPVAELTRDDYRRSLELNAIAVADVTRLLLPALRIRRGLVVAINSGSGLRASPHWAAYAASKFALRAITLALRAEEARNGVRVTSIHPGRADTDMQREIRAAEGGDYQPDRYLEPRAIAEAVRLAVDTPASGYIDELSIRPVG